MEGIYFLKICFIFLGNDKKFVQLTEISNLDVKIEKFFDIRVDERCSGISVDMGRSRKGEGKRKRKKSEECLI